MAIGCAVLMCHAPIVVPGIAGGRASLCQKSTRTMHETARIVVAHEPELVVLVNPHAPRRPNSWGIVHERSLSGNFARFGHADLELSYRGAPDAAADLALEATARGLAVHNAPAELDHGALVPLFFLHEAGYRGPVLLVALPYPGTNTERVFGSAVRSAAEARAARWAVIASGDMSHRLTEDAPAGFDARAHEFDATFVGHLRQGEPLRAVNIDPELANRAAEDVVQSTAVALGAVGDRPRGCRVLSYEGPFGVGYCQALLHSERAVPLVPEPPTRLAEVAYEAIHYELRSEVYQAPVLRAPWDRPKPVFVTLRNTAGVLRGCIGRTDPVHSYLAEEVADCAVAAATRDYRMACIELAELSELRIEVSVLGTPERVTSERELDPAHYGVVVSKGMRRGVLLPQVDGVDTVEDQLRIALRKGGIDPREAYRLERFTVTKIVRDPC